MKKKWYRITFYAEHDPKIIGEMLHRPLTDLLTQASRIEDISVYDTEKLEEKNQADKIPVQDEGI